MKKEDKINGHFYPTPMYELKNLNNKIGKAKIFIKRDDLIGVALGGNKLRKLDYIVQDAKESGCNVLLTYGGVQTNHGRLTAAMAAKAGMKSVIICFGSKEEFEDLSGNLILDRMLGSEVIFVEVENYRSTSTQEFHNHYGDKINDITDKVVEEYESKGDKVYIIPGGGHNIVAVQGYMDVVKEIMDQMNNMNNRIDYVVAGFGSGATYAGLLLGKKYYKAPFKIIGISTSYQEEYDINRLLEYLRECNAQLNLDIEDITKEELVFYNDYMGEGYNMPDRKTREHIYELAQTEGIFVDPAYTGKVYRGVRDLVDKEIVSKDSNVLFIHTGGIPGIYTKAHLEAMQVELWGEENYRVF